MRGEMYHLPMMGKLSCVQQPCWLHEQGLTYLLLPSCVPLSMYIQARKPSQPALKQLQCFNAVILICLHSKL